MSQPFVVSLKLVGDSSSAVQATQEEQRALEALDRTVTRVAGGGSGLQQRIDSMLGIGARRGSSADDGFAAFGKGLDELRAKFNPLFAAEQRQTAAIAEINRAHRLGALTADEASAAILRERQAYDSLTQSLAANSNARTHNTGLQSLNTANVAAQFQDIGVTSAMGMSPLQIALQQGTQLSAVLGTTGAAGAAATLRAALFSVLSPVSLITIAAVGLGAAGIQAFMGMGREAEEANDSLEKHGEWLKEILTGYEAAGDAAEAAIDRAKKLPQGVVASDLAASLKDQEAAAGALQSRIDAARAGLASTAEFIRELQFSATSIGGDGVELQKLIDQVEYLNNLGLNTSATKDELDAAAVAARELFNTTDDDGIKAMADQVYQLASELMAARGEADATAASLAALQNQALLADVSASADTAFAAIERLKDLAPDLRTEYEKASDALNAALGSSPDGVLRSAALAQYQDTVAALDAQAAQQEAQRAARDATRLAKQKSDYDQAIESIRERTASQEIEARVIGLSTFASTRLRVQMELENAARKDAIGLTPARVAEIEKEASAQARLATQIEQNNDLYQTGQSVTQGFIVGLGRAAEDGTVTLEEFGDAAATVFDTIRDKALGLVADGIWDMVFGAVFGGGKTGGSNLLSFIPGFGGVGKNARGTNNWSGGLTRVNEEGGEIIDLPNNTRIIPHDVSMEMARSGAGSGFAPTFVNSFTVAGGAADIPAYQRILDQRDEALLSQVHQLVAAYLANPMRRPT